ncbi:MAG TPA: hypothetical protein VIG76_04680 [Amnibacterium sp.]|jgi:heme A synthase|uniref:hypothetical protein n=1 Tax=Amnibacterium sp. TaxID=1872496 RepID=UPI002F94B65E
MSDTPPAARHRRNLLMGLVLIVAAIVVLAAHVGQPAAGVAVLVFFAGIVLCATSLARILRRR